MCLLSLDRWRATAARAGVDNPAAPQLDPDVRNLKEQLSLTKQQTNKLNEIFQDTNAQRTALAKQMMELQKKGWSGSTPS